MFSPLKGASSCITIFSVEGSERSSKNRHILMHLRHLILLHLFLLPKATKCLLKNATSWWVLSRFLWMASERRPLNAALHKKLSLRSFHRKFYTIKDGTQTNDFIADKSCLLFFIILKVLSRWQVIRTQGKCIKSYKIFLKDFVVKQNLTGVNK